RVPGDQLDAAEIGQPQQTGPVLADVVVPLLAAAVETQADDLQPGWALPGDALEELLAVVAVHVAVQDLGPIREVRRYSPNFTICPGPATGLCQSSFPVRRSYAFSTGLRSSLFSSSWTTNARSPLTPSASEFQSTRTLPTRFFSPTLKTSQNS